MSELGIAREASHDRYAIDIAGHLLLLLLRTDVRFSIRGRRDGLRQLGRRRGLRPLDSAGRQVAHDAVGDAEDARELVPRLPLGVELEQVVDALALVVDLVGEAAAPPDVLPLPPAAAALDQLARSRDDLLLALLRHVRIEHQQNLVRHHTFPRPPFLWSESASSACA